MSHINKQSLWNANGGRFPPYLALGNVNILWVCVMNVNFHQGGGRENKKKERLEERTCWLLNCRIGESIRHHLCGEQTNRVGKAAFSALLSGAKEYALRPHQALERPRRRVLTSFQAMLMLRHTSRVTMIQCHVLNAYLLSFKHPSSTTKPENDQSLP